MSDEKTMIYISPDEDLTSVRERLEQIPARYITLVIPTETQLRSHVAWKLLRARVRELGKEVQIVSDSAQVRSVAKDVNFKVASSLEASPTGKSRPPGRTSRTIGNRSRPTGSTQRPSTRKSTGLRSSEHAYSPNSENPWAAEGDQGFEQPDVDNEVLEEENFSRSRSSSPSFNNDFPLTPERGQHYDFHIDTSPPIRPLPPQYLDEEPDLWSEDTDVARSIREAASHSGAHVPGDQEQEDDFDLVRDDVSSASAPPEATVQQYRTTPRPNLGDDPFDSMNDALSPPSVKYEQRGAVHALDNFETQQQPIHDVPVVPIDIVHDDIEDEGDQGNFVIHSDSSPANLLREPIPEDDQDRAGPARVHGVRPRTSRTGRQSSPQPPLTPVTPGQMSSSDDDLPSIADLPTQMTPQTPFIQPAASGTGRPSRDLQPRGTRSGTLAPGPRSGSLAPRDPSRVSGAMTPQNSRLSGGLQGQVGRPSGTLPQNQRRSSSLAPEQPRQASRSTQLRPEVAAAPRSGSSPLTTTTGRNRAVLSRPGTRMGGGRGVTPSRQDPPSRTIMRQPPRRNRRSGLVFGILTVVVLLIIILLVAYYLLPSATVAITLPAQDYSVPVKLVADPNSKTNVAAGIIQATTLKKDFTISGTGKATGTTKIGTATATGTVFFTNSGNQQIVIPSNILLSTSNGTQFMVQANVSVGPKNSGLNRLPTLVQAQVSGDTGNVPAGSIIVIPTDSKNQIAQYNKILLTDLKLQVTNDSPTSGGGVGSAISVTQKDLNDTQTALSNQLQNSVTTWVQQQLATGDIVGKPIITPTLTNAPKVDAIEQNSTFPANLTQNVEISLVHNTLLQSATIAQLNTALTNDKNFQNYQIVSDAQQPVQIPKFTPTSNGLAMTLSFKPTGRIVPKIDEANLPRKIVNKSPVDAEDTLKSLMPVIQSAKVTLSPSWLPATPLQAGNIHIQVVAGSASPAKK